MDLQGQDLLASSGHVDLIVISLEGKKGSKVAGPWEPLPAPWCLAKPQVLHFAISFSVWKRKQRTEKHVYFHSLEGEVVCLVAWYPPVHLQVIFKTEMAVFCLSFVKPCRWCLMFCHWHLTCLLRCMYDCTGAAQLRKQNRLRSWCAKPERSSRTFGVWWTLILSPRQPKLQHRLLRSLEIVITYDVYYIYVRVYIEYIRISI